MSLGLVVSGIRKSYSGLPVLKGCSFSFEKNGIYVLIGPNGSGKSTFLRICSLLENPDSGDVNFIDNRTQHSLPSAGDISPSIPPVPKGGIKGSILKNDINVKRRVTLVLPRIGMFNTTVFNNVAYGLKIRGAGKREITDRVHSVLDKVGLAHKKEKNALTLSSGESQRLGIARAIAINPEILFLDEPTASLDPQSTTIIEELIFRIKQQNSMIIVMVTHNIFQARRLSDTVLFIYEGKIVEHGPNKEFFERPKDDRTSRFITGRMVY